MPRKKQKVTHDENACKLCQTSNDNEVLYGKMVKTESGNVHHFCILFACGLTQNGADDEGCFGFLPEDIRKEIIRANKLKCSFCKQNTVASACAIKACRKTYHFNCGLMNDVLFNFFECFPSYCVKHRPQLDDDYRTVDPKLKCNICFDQLQIVENEDTSRLQYQILRTLCCRKFLHINCVKEQAHNAGIHHIKCPLCNDRDQFIKCAQEHGVYIPDRDATWEDPNIWRAQESRYSKCDASICRSKNGREYNEENSEWEINLCNTCGSSGIHTACSSDLSLNEEEFEYECLECKKVTKKNEPAITRNEPTITRNEPAITRNEPAVQRNEPMIVTCEPPSSSPEVRFDDSSRSSKALSESKTEIELIELSSDDDEEEDHIICVDDDSQDGYKKFSGSSLAGQKGRSMGNDLTKITNFLNSQNR